MSTSNEQKLAFCLKLLRLAEATALEAQEKKLADKIAEVKKDWGVWK